jgi:hypothetical protein
MKNIINERFLNYQISMQQKMQMTPELAQKQMQ